MGGGSVSSPQPKSTYTYVTESDAPRIRGLDALHGVYKSRIVVPRRREYA